MNETVLTGIPAVTLGINLQKLFPPVRVRETALEMRPRRAGRTPLLRHNLAATVVSLGNDEDTPGNQVNLAGSGRSCHQLNSFLFAFCKKC